jgi:hypothetical protein
MLRAHGWVLFAHPLFLGQVERLTAAAERARAKDPDGYRQNANVRLGWADLLRAARADEAQERLSDAAARARTFT